MIHIGSAHVTRNITQNKCKCEKGPGTQQVPLNRYSHVHPIPLYHGTGETVHGTGETVHGTGGTVSMGQVRGLDIG